MNNECGHHITGDEICGNTAAGSFEGQALCHRHLVDEARVCASVDAKRGGHDQWRGLRFTDAEARLDAVLTYRAKYEQFLLSV